MPEFGVDLFIIDVIIPLDITLRAWKECRGNWLKHLIAFNQYSREPVFLLLVITKVDP
jgi:hypothetical protein